MACPLMSGLWIMHKCIINLQEIFYEPFPFGLSSWRRDCVNNLYCRKIPLDARSRSGKDNCATYSGTLGRFRLAFHYLPLCLARNAMAFLSQRKRLISVNCLIVLEMFFKSMSFKDLEQYTLLAFTLS